ncbi:hypothetical protein [Parvibaculum sp.]|jgi:hypothetical protein|uniref:hypothetical protein n=1 Tax=Parvibaculum sp. TaxID=2024848 RepID=UPI001B23895D|nr:hypothetical protein [Parvibaculum sp.]MBO6635806.1 hypothetical protein [Parvibaculum sp.]MBO6680261.1 hypothetical protein [Parvibaculum sp.]MBO6685893.1 hypothetical protein [Parvibaculum sp.]MBO6906551.1 hypothetical protein [Parvibaculum sp.]
MSDQAWGRGVKSVAAAAALLVAVAGCSAFSDDAKPDAMYGGTPSEAPEDAAFPDLRDVPEERPEVTTLDERQGLAKGLAADREKAIHSDRVLRGGTEAPAPAPVVSRPTPVPELGDVPEGQDKQSLYEAAPTLPLPSDRGGHSDYSKVLPKKEVQTAAKEADEEPEVMTEDGAAAQSSAEDTGPEVTPAPTRHVTVKPSVGQP